VNLLSSPCCVLQLVGQRWAALSRAEKQRYADVAAKVRKQMGGANGGGAIGDGAGPPRCGVAGRLWAVLAVFRAGRLMGFVSHITEAWP
jgi:hypothetical protein